MKLKKILASLTAAALAVTTMAFAPLSVSAAEYDNTKPFIELDGSTQYSALNAWRTAKNVSDGTGTYSFTTTTSNDYMDSFAENGMTAYFFDEGKGVFTDIEIVFAGATGVDYSDNVVNAEWVKNSSAFGKMKESNSTWDFVAESNALAGGRSEFNFIPEGNDNMTYPKNAEVTVDIKATFVPIGDTVNAWTDNGDGSYSYRQGTSGSSGQDLLIPIPGNVNLENVKTIKAKVTTSGYAQAKWAGDGITSPDSIEFQSQSKELSVDADGLLTGNLCMKFDWINPDSLIYVDDIEFVEKTKIAPVVTVVNYDGEPEEEWGFTSDYSDDQIIDEMKNHVALKITDAEGTEVELEEDDFTLTGSIENGVYTATFALTDKGQKNYKLTDNAVLTDSCKISVIYSVEVLSNNESYGTAEVVGDYDVFFVDEIVTLTATPNPGYKFVMWESADVTVSENNTFAMPEKDVSVTAVFEEDSFTLTVTSDENGTASAKVDGAAAPAKVVAGKKVTLSAEPKTGYRFVKWTVTGVSLDDVTAENVTFTMPAADVSVKAAFEEIPAGEHAVKVNTADGGTAGASEKSAIKNTEITLTVNPDTGYEFDKWTVSPETVVITDNKFTMPDEDVTITPVFKKATYSVELETSVVGGNAKVSKTAANMGDAITVEATPDDGYEVEKITVDGEAVKVAENKASFTMPAKNVVVIVTFKKLPGTADAEVVAPEGVTVSFAGSKEDIIAAVFGDDYAKLVESGVKLDVVMTVKDESAVSDTEKEVLKNSLSKNQYIGLVLDVVLVKTVDGVSEAVAETVKPVSFSISVPDDIIADGRTYSVLRIHNGEAQNIGGTYDSSAKTITVSSDLFSTYAIVYDEAAPAPEPEPEKPVIRYSVVSDNHTTVSASSAVAGAVISVKTEFGYDAQIFCGGVKIASVSDRGEFKMPAGNVRIVSVENGYLTMARKTLPNSYIFVYDSDMNYIRTNGSTRGINVEGKITVKLGEEYAGKTITLYKGRKNTDVKVAAKTLNEDGNATFTVSAGMNYTAVVE